MSIPPSSFQTAGFLLSQAQQAATEVAAKAQVPIVTECGLAESTRVVKGEEVRGYAVTVTFFVPHAIADAVASDS